MESNKWIDFVIAFTDKLNVCDYNGAIDMAVDVDSKSLTESQAGWLKECITKIRKKYNI